MHGDVDLFGILPYYEQLDNNMYTSKCCKLEIKVKFIYNLYQPIRVPTGWKNVYFPGSKPNFPQFELCLYVQKCKISPQIPKFPSTYQYFSGMSFPNSPFFLTMRVPLSYQAITLASSMSYLKILLCIQQVHFPCNHLVRSILYLPIGLQQLYIRSNTLDRSLQI